MRLGLLELLWFGLIAKARVLLEDCQALALRWVCFEELSEVALLVVGSVVLLLVLVVPVVLVWAAAGVAVGAGDGCGFLAVGTGGCRQTAEVLLVFACCGY